MTKDIQKENKTYLRTRNYSSLSQKCLACDGLNAPFLAGYAVWWILQIFGDGT